MRIGTALPNVPCIPVLDCSPPVTQRQFSSLGFASGCPRRRICRSRELVPRRRDGLALQLPACPQAASKSRRKAQREAVLTQLPQAVPSAPGGRQSCARSMASCLCDRHNGPFRATQPLLYLLRHCSAPGQSCSQPSPPLPTRSPLSPHVFPLAALPSSLYNPPTHSSLHTPLYPAPGTTSLPRSPPTRSLNSAMSERCPACSLFGLGPSRHPFWPPLSPHLAPQSSHFGDQSTLPL